MDRLSAMRVFVVVVEKGSFTLAAKHLELNRVKVTRYVTALESWLGVRLLQRSTRRLSLTPAGENFLQQCYSLLAISEEMQDCVASAATIPQGQLRVTATTAFATSHLSEAITDFLSLYPKVSVDMMMVPEKVSLIDDQVDLAIRIADQLDPGLIARKIAQCRSVLCASPNYLKTIGKPKQLSDLSRHNCLLFAQFDTYQWHLSDGNTSESVTVSGRLRSNDVLALLKATQHGAGIARLPRYLVSEELHSGALVEVLPQWHAKPMSIWAVYQSRQHMPAALRGLIDFLVERFSHQHDW
ncbi:LysR family transcriptional regulator [Vibrio sp. WXL103]|uniref:LysR family transcriptional regulator n=1 Tax=unclassified Vibrio TaxID=2614977 RepID=UPI003EC5A8D7